MPTYLLSPSFWLGALISGAIVFGSGVYVGVRWEKSDNAESIITAQDAAIKGANKGAEAATKLALEQASKDTQHRLANQGARLAGEIDAAKKSRPGCARDTESMRLLSTSIDTANGGAAASREVPSVVRIAPKASGWFGTVFEKLGISDSGPVQPVPPAAR